MKAGKYNIKELFANKNIEAVIIPEIQRDYVWGTQQVEGLLLSILDDYADFESSKSQINVSVMNDASFEKALSDYYKSIKYNTSIGFIYAYSDFEYPDKYFLIDGQQRLTTIYLLLVAIASEDEKFKSQFSKLYFNNCRSFIEYRVREASLLFLNQAINHNLQNSKTALEDQHWYYNFYENDKTIQSVIKNLKTIKTFLSDKIHDISAFREYVLQHVQFWYFDTNISEQGEELYIYMNARGEQMQSNENLKAELLAQVFDPDQKNVWGSKWEEWQDVFWQIRGTNENADQAFNEFVFCIAGLENQKTNSGIYIKNSNKGFLQPSNSQLLQCFRSNSISAIEKYVDALKMILGNDILAFCKGNDLYYDWIIKTRNDIRKLLNSTQTNYFIKIDDQNRGTEQNRLVLIWSLLELFSDTKEVDLNLIVSFRIIYNRYHNYIRAVASNLNDVLKFKYDGFEAIILENINDEENLKYLFLKNQKHNPDFHEILSLIWQIEDHPINLDGSYLKNINSIHLIDYVNNPTVVQLELVKRKFYELFPIKDDKSIDWVNYGKVLNCLITYGKCWNAKVTNGYDNLDFDSERRIVRDADAEEDKCFLNFFNDYLKADSLENLEQNILSEPVYNDQSEEWLDAIRWYNFKLRDKMWKEGFYIAMGNHNHRKKDKHFPNIFRLVNTKGNFNGGNPVVLSSQIKTANS